MPLIRDLLSEGTQRLRRAGVDSPAFDARELLLYALGFPDAAALYRSVSNEADASAEARYRGLIARRAQRYPLQYLLGFWEFYGRRFHVREGALIPRPDTETLVDAAIVYCKKSRISSHEADILDLCSGTGVLAITLALELPGSRADAVECSVEAADILRENVRQYQAPVRVLQADALQYRPDRAYDIILSNPPYIAESEYPNLPPEVLCEPKLALTAENNGMRFYQEFVRRYPEYLKPGGLLLLEAGAGQAEAVLSLLREAGASHDFVQNDCSGIPRAVGGCFSNGYTATQVTVP